LSVTYQFFPVCLFCKYLSVSIAGLPADLLSVWISTPVPVLKPVVVLLMNDLPIRLTTRVVAALIDIKSIEKQTDVKVFI